MFVAEYITAFIKARKESKDKITRVIRAWSAREETIHEEGFQDGATFGYNKAKEEDKWHYPSKGELPKCDEETQLIFYVNCYYEVGGETFTRKRTVLGFYKKSFLNDDVKLFVEKSKGYEDEHLPKDVIAWKEIDCKEIKEK